MKNKEMIEKKSAEKFLLVDDEEEALQSYDLILSSIGYFNNILCSDSRKVLDILKTQNISLIILDLKMPHISGEDLLRDISTLYPRIPVLIITGNMEIDSAVICMREGAFDYLVKPIEKSRLVTSIRIAMERSALLKENRLLKHHLLTKDVGHLEVFSKVNSKNKQMYSIFRYVQAVASSPEPILITGETGVGKELLAKTIHELSGRKGEMVSISVPGLDDTLFSDTLFGHKAGAFTDAKENRIGLVEKASGGTLFLDEIGDLNLQSQVKILRLIQEKEYSPLGDDSVHKSNVRIVSATNMDLTKLIDSGKFRKDLFYRLEVHNINSPPLRERREDLELLIRHFVDTASKTFGKKVFYRIEDLIQLLRNYDFPGNIRELRSMIYNAVSLHEKGALSLKSFREKIKKNNGELKASRNDVEIDKEWQMVTFPRPLPTLDQIKKTLINEALNETGGNKTLTAEILGISRQTLIRKLKGQNS